MIVLPFNPCHDSLQHSPSSSLSSSCNDSAGIYFRRLADAAFSFLSWFFQPHFLIIKLPAYVARETEFFGPHRALFFVHLRFAEFIFFFGKGKQAGSLPYLSHVFYKRDPSLFSHKPRWQLAKQEGILKYRSVVAPKSLHRALFRNKKLTQYSQRL